MIVCGIYICILWYKRWTSRYRKRAYTHTHIPNNDYKCVYMYVIFIIDLQECKIIYYINTILSRVARAKIISRSRRGCTWTAARARVLYKSSPFTNIARTRVVGAAATMSQPRGEPTMDGRKNKQIKIVSNFI